MKESYLVFFKAKVEPNKTSFAQLSKCPKGTSKFNRKGCVVTADSSYCGVRWDTPIIGIPQIELLSCSEDIKTEEKMIPIPIETNINCPKLGYLTPYIIVCCLFVFALALLITFTRCKRRRCRQCELVLDEKRSSKNNNRTTANEPYDEVEMMSHLDGRQPRLVQENSVLVSSSRQMRQVNINVTDDVLYEEIEFDLAGATAVSNQVETAADGINQKDITTAVSNQKEITAVSSQKNMLCQKEIATAVLNQGEITTAVPIQEEVFYVSQSGSYIYSLELEPSQRLHPVPIYSNDEFNKIL